MPRKMVISQFAHMIILFKKIVQRIIFSNVHLHLTATNVNSNISFSFIFFLRWKQTSTKHRLKHLSKQVICTMFDFAFCKKVLNKKAVSRITLANKDICS